MYSEEQLLIKQACEQFAQEELAPHAGQWDKNSTFPKAAISQMGELGLMGMLIPDEYDGAQTDYVSFVLAMEAIATGCASCATIMGVNNSVVCMPVYNYGTEKQKEEFLKPLASGQALGAFCLTEPQTGSDAAAITAFAEQTATGFVLNGTKQFITSGKNADYAIVIAVTDKKAGKKGMSAFIIPTNSQGYNVARVEEKLGQKASDTAQIVFENCHIPQENLLGELGQGYKIALSNLEGGRLGIAAQSVGIASAALQAAVDYCRERRSFEVNLIDHQSVAFTLAEMKTELTAARELILYAARLRDQQLPCMQAAAMAKLFASTTAEKICSRALHLLGGYGYLNDFPLERHYRDVKVTQIYEGTNEIQKMIIARGL